MKEDNVNNSFNEDFCIHLEYHLCRTFANEAVDKFNVFWCDGVSWAPYYSANANMDYLSVENILKRKKIITSANIGVDGQDYYEISLLLGEKALSNYEFGLSLIDCLPNEESMDWISLDISNKKIELKLK